MEIEIETEIERVCAPLVQYTTSDLTQKVEIASFLHL